MPDTQPNAAEARLDALPLAPRAPRTLAQRISAIQGWQYDRRRSLLVLRVAEKRAHDRGDRLTADALWSAAYDVEEILRERAALEIACSVRMHGSAS